MAPKHPDEARLYCPRCGNEVTEEATGSFLGFPKHVCETCTEALHAPLEARSRLIWWGIAMVGLGSADILLLMKVVIPGLVGLGVAAIGVAGLVANVRLQRAHRTRGRNIWLVHLARRTAHISESMADSH
jgi:hypothetical protein